MSKESKPLFIKSYIAGSSCRNLQYSITKTSEQLRRQSSFAMPETTPVVRVTQYKKKGVWLPPTVFVSPVALTSEEDLESFIASLRDAYKQKDRLGELKSEISY